jgi:hypothetical protein
VRNVNDGATRNRKRRRPPPADDFTDRRGSGRFKVCDLRQR